MQQEINEQAELVSAFRQIAEAITSMSDARDLRHVITGHICSLLTADRSAIFAWDDREGALVAAFAVPGEPPIPPIAAGSGPIGAAFELRRPILVDDFQSAPQMLRGTISLGVRAVATVPLIIARRTIGVLAVLRLRPQPFSTAQAETLSLLAALVVAPLLELARLQGQVTDQKVRLRAEARRLIEPGLTTPHLELTRRERQVIPLLAEGRTNREIGTALQLTPGTVRNVVGRLLKKLGARDRTHAVVLAIAQGLHEG